MLNFEKINYLLKIKNISNKEKEKLKEKIQELKKTLITYIADINNEELLSYYILTKKEEEIKEKIYLNNYYKINNNNYQENIGDLVQVKIKNNEHIGIFLGSFPEDYEVQKENDKIHINFNNQNGIIYIPELNKLFSTKEIWFKRIEKEKMKKIKNKINKILKENINEGN